MGPVFQAVMFVVSIAFQVAQTNKLRREQEAAADKAKGSLFSVKNEAISLPVVYGRQLIGGVQFDHSISGNYKYSAPSNNSIIFDSGNDIPHFVSGGIHYSDTDLTSVYPDFDYSGPDTGALDSSVSGTKNEFMFAKHALCHSGINGVKHVSVQNKSYNHKDYKKGQRIIVHTEGGSDKTLRANGYVSTDVFTNVAWAAEIFRMDREKNNYSGAPDVQFIVEGQKVRSITFNGTTYALTTAKSYTTNPALILVDYLTNNIYGKGLLDSEIDLASFYHAAQICDTTVLTNAKVAGHIWGSKPISNYSSYAAFPSPNAWGFEDVLLKDDSTGKYYYWKKTGGTNQEPIGAYYVTTVPKRNIPLYECNLTLNTETSIRDNIETILATMNYAELTWDTNGKYKLLLEYPANSTETNLLVSHSFNKDNILRDTFTISFPAAQDKYNFATVSFQNENEDFKSDTVSWPTKGSAVYNQYLTEDNNQPFEISLSGVGITDPYHALARAEQIVRSSRSIYTIDFKTTRYGLTVEPGDFIEIQLDEVGLVTPEIFRVQSIKIDNDFNVQIQATYFDEAVLAWNIRDGVAYPKSKDYSYILDTVSNISVDLADNNNKTSVGRLLWDYPNDLGFGLYLYDIYYKEHSTSNYRFLAQSKDKEYVFGWLKGMETSNNYDFKIIVKNSLGVSSDPAYYLNVDLVISPEQPTSISVLDELYITNSAAGVKARAVINWTRSNSGVYADNFKVEYKLNSDTEYKIAGSTRLETITIQDMQSGSYTVRITPSSIYSKDGTPLIANLEVAGLDAPPATPINFSGNVNEGQISLTWDPPTDLDVMFGGYTEIRHHSSSNGNASWDTASILVQQVTGSMTNKTVPTLKGTFYIKFVDSSGNKSIDPAVFISTFEDQSFNQIETLEEYPTGFSGVKTNCTVNDGFLELSAGFTSMEYDFGNIVDLGEVVTARVSSEIVATVTDRNSLVSSYSNISLLQKFSGPIKNAHLEVYISTTQDNPSGTPTWSDYELLTISSITCRAMRFKFQSRVDDPNTVVIIRELNALIDKKDIIKTGKSTSSNSANTTVTFSTPFYGGPGGTNSPTIGLQVIGGAQGDEIIIVSRSKTGFVYSIYNGSSRVARSIDWQAIGQ